LPNLPDELKLIRNNWHRVPIIGLLAKKDSPSKVEVGQNNYTKEETNDFVLSYDPSTNFTVVKNVKKTQTIPLTLEKPFVDKFGKQWYRADSMDLSAQTGEEYLIPSKWKLKKAT
jgi:hypothetical protein